MISLVSIAFVSIVSALITWILRTRAAKRRKFPWGEPVADYDKEDGFVEKGTPFNDWDPGAHGSTRRSSSSTVAMPQNAVLNSKHSLPESAAFPLPLNGYYPWTAAHSSVPNLNSVHPDTVNTIGVNSSAPNLNSHYPDTNTLGPLQIANMLPGDIHASNASTASFHSLPDDSSSDDSTSNLTRPRFLGLNGNGLDVPWAPASPGMNKERIRAAWDGSGSSTPNIPDTEFGVVRPSALVPDVPQAQTGTWTASIRNAFAAVSSSFGPATPNPNAASITSESFYSQSKTSDSSGSSDSFATVASSLDSDEPRQPSDIFTPKPRRHSTRNAVTSGTGLPEHGKWEPVYVGGDFVGIDLHDTDQDDVQEYSLPPLTFQETKPLDVPGKDISFSPGGIGRARLGGLAFVPEDERCDESTPKQQYTPFPSTHWYPNAAPGPSSFNFNFNAESDLSRKDTIANSILSRASTISMDQDEIVAGRLLRERMGLGLGGREV